MSIGEFCNRDVAVITADESILDAARVMRDQHVGDVIVVARQGGIIRPIGILTDRDIVLEVIAQDVKLDSVNAGDIMSRELLLAKETDAVPNIVNQMRRKGVRRVPVVNEQGGLEGIFSLDDLLELLAEQLNDFVTVIHKETNREQRLRN